MNFSATHSKVHWVSISLIFFATLGAFAAIYSYLSVYGSAAPYFRPQPHVMPDRPQQEKSGIILPAQANNAFKAGELLEYKVTYKGVTVGHATLSVSNGPIVNGRPTLQIKSSAKSTPFFDSFFKVRDTNISTIDKASLYSLSFHQNLREGKYRAVRDYAFNYDSKKFKSAIKRSGATREREGTLDAPLHDVLSALYFTRTLDLKPGGDYSVPIYREGSMKRMPLTVKEKTKKMDTPAGKQDYIQIEPMVKGDSIFRSDDGRLLIWMTNDDRKIPAILEAKISVGLVRVRLTGIKNN